MTVEYQMGFEVGKREFSLGAKPRFYNGGNTYPYEPEYAKGYIEGYHQAEKEFHDSQEYD